MTMKMWTTNGNGRDGSRRRRSCSLVLGILFLVVFSSWQDQATVLVLASSTSSSSSEMNMKESFLRVMHRELGSSDDNKLPNYKGLGQCDTGCHSDDDCQPYLVCYFRNKGDVLPDCPCDGSKTNGKNYCVPAGCAAYTFDDDDKVAAKSKLQKCEGDCHANSDCADDLICYQREAGDSIPPCCKDKGFSGKGADDICAPKSCHPTYPPSSTSPPTFAPFDAGQLTSGLCFSGNTVVDVYQRGHVPMKDLQVGDLVRTSTKDTYEAVYAFAHIDKKKRSHFLQIHTESSFDIAPLEVTDEHMVYIEGKPGPVRADTVNIGDVLQSMEKGTSKRKVTAIKHIVRKGVFTPLTPSGKIWASGVITSTYIALQSKSYDEYVELSHIGAMPLHQADLVHLWLSPLRLLCMNALPTHTRTAICNTYNEDGKLHYVEYGLQLARFMDEKPLYAQMVVFIPLFVLLTLFMVVEYLLGAVNHTLIFLVLSRTIVAWLRRTTFGSCKKSKVA